MTIDDCPGNVFDSAKDAKQHTVSPASCGSKEQSHEHAALQAWCSLMNAYLENVSMQRKSQLLEEWQNAEQRLTRVKMPGNLPCGELN